MIVQEIVVERPIVEETLVDRFANKKMVAEGSVTKNTINKKIEVDLVLV